LATETRTAIAFSFVTLLHSLLQAAKLPQVLSFSNTISNFQHEGCCQAGYRSAYSVTALADFFLTSP
jgi:hypothetical protein